MGIPVLFPTTYGGTRRKRGRGQRGGLIAWWGHGQNAPSTAGGTRRKRGRGQRGGQIQFYPVPVSNGGTRRKRGRGQRGGIMGMQTQNPDPMD